MPLAGAFWFTGCRRFISGERAERRKVERKIETLLVGHVACSILLYMSYVNLLPSDLRYIFLILTTKLPSPLTLLTCHTY